MNYLFSVIIPVRNEEKTIGKLLDRITKFTSQYSTEIIVIYSGSSDKTPEIVNQKKVKNGHIKLVHIKPEDFDHSNTRNHGVKIAKGKYTCFISGDAIPIEKRSFQYFKSDLESDPKVVAVFGKEIYPHSLFLFDRLDRESRFTQLDKYSNNKGLLIFDLSSPFIRCNSDTAFFWYTLFNTFSCYKRNFLLKYPLPKNEYAGDILLGKLITNKKFKKIYDNRCKILHYHSQSLKEYCSTLKEEYALRYVKLQVKKKIFFSSRLKQILESEVKNLNKIKYIGFILVGYFLKISIYFYLMMFRLFNNKNFTQQHQQELDSSYDMLV